MEATAKHDFNATSEDELSFKKGAIIKILNKDEDEHWFKAELNGQEGMIPANYVQMKAHDWFKGNMPRPEAEKTLKDQPHDGAFLLRESQQTPGEFSISVKNGSKVQHFKVLRDGHGRYFLWAVKFNSLNELVDFHRKNSVSRMENIYLKDMVKKKRALVLYNFVPQEEGEIALKKGETVIVFDDTDKNWFRGRANGKDGLFPAPYVKIL